jgi:hypothetical protein
MNKELSELLKNTNRELTIGFEDFAVCMEDGTVIKENISQEEAFSMLENSDTYILQVWGYNKAEDCMCWNDIK